MFIAQLIGCQIYVFAALTFAFPTFSIAFIIERFSNNQKLAEFLSYKVWRMITPTRS
jgi:hypothetical protein